MKASKLIDQLKELIEEHGDLEIQVLKQSANEYDDDLYGSADRIFHEHGITPNYFWIE